MAAAALLSLSGAEAALRKALRACRFPGTGSGGVGSSAGVAGTRVHVNVSRTQAHGRRLPDIIALLRASSLPGEVRARRSPASSGWGGGGEGPRRPVGKVHFHEVGAVDAIVDIVSGCFLFEHLGAPKAFCSSLPGGSGEAGSEHGKIPVPGRRRSSCWGRAVAVRGGGRGAGDADGGGPAAGVRRLLRRPPVMTVRGVGTGLGHREIPGRPNLLRVVAGDPVPGAPGGTASSRSRRTSTT